MSVAKVNAGGVELTGDNTLPIHQAVNDELERLVGSDRRVTLHGANHSMWMEQPRECEAATLAFLRSDAV